MPCLSTEELAALYDCVLPRQQSENLRTHLAECPRCAHEIKVLSRILKCRDQIDKNATPGARLIERARELARKPIDHLQVNRERTTSQPAESPGRKKTVPKNN